jgi:hypothetical protein
MVKLMGSSPVPSFCFLFIDSGRIFSFWRGVVLRHWYMIGHVLDTTWLWGLRQSLHYRRVALFVCFSSSFLHL